MSSLRSMMAAGCCLGLFGLVGHADELESAPRRAYLFGHVAARDESGAAVPFASPAAIAVASDGTVYLGDTGNYVIRKISPGGKVSTLAGAVGQAGYVDGLRGAARFGPIVGLAVDRTGNLVVADGRIRKVSTGGVVTTLGPAEPGSSDASGAPPWHGQATAVVVDAEGNVIFADSFQSAIRKISADGIVTTIATGWGTESQPRIGSGATFSDPRGLAIDRRGNIYVAAATGGVRFEALYGVVRIGTDGVASLVVEDEVSHTHPIPDVVRVIGRASLFVDANDDLYAVSFSLSTILRIGKDGIVEEVGGSSGEIGDKDDWGTNARFNRPLGLAVDARGCVYLADTGNQAIRVGVPLWQSSDTRLAALAVRSRAGAGDQTLIMGFAVAGANTHDVLVRGLGPTLTDAGLDDVVRDPKLLVFHRGEVIAQNDNWSEELMPVFARLGAGSPRQNSRDAALVVPVSSGAYTAHVEALEGGSGLVLAEVYDAEPDGEGRLKALAARSRAGVGNDVLIAGFVLVGNAPKTVLIRAVGPSLAQQGVSGVLVDPRLRLFRGGVEIEENDDWGGTAGLKEVFARVGLGTFESEASKDAALLVSLEPGVYSVHVSGAEGGTGIALVEIYEVE